MSKIETPNYQDPKCRGLLPIPSNYLTSQQPKTKGLLPTPTNAQYYGLNQSIRQNFPQTKRKNNRKYKPKNWSHQSRQQPKSALETPLLTRQQPKSALETPLLIRQQPKSALETPLLIRQQPKSALETPAKTPCLIKNPITVVQQVEQTKPANTEKQHLNLVKIVRTKKMTKTEFLEQRFEKLYAEFQRQKEAGIYEPQKDKHCSITIRKNELCFFQGENPPRMRGTYKCCICDREKRAMLRHNPSVLLDGDSLITCFMCSEKLGWVYYCSYCAQRNRHH